jgi:hypothetical protein
MNGFKMLYGFVIAESINTGEPCSEYFLSVERAACAAVARKELGADQALDACEYLDCVDSGALRCEPSLYRSTVETLSGYLEFCPRADAQALACKSAAAKTILTLVGAACQQASIRSFQLVG